MKNDREIKLIVDDAALRVLRRHLNASMLCSSDSLFIEPMHKIVKALETGKDTVTLRLKDKDGD